MHHDLIKTPIKNYNIIFPEVIVEVFFFLGPTLIYHRIMESQEWSILKAFSSFNQPTTSVNCLCHWRCCFRTSVVSSRLLEAVLSISIHFSLLEGLLHFQQPLLVDKPQFPSVSPDLSPAGTQNPSCFYILGPQIFEDNCQQFFFSSPESFVFQIKYSFSVP